MTIKKALFIIIVVSSLLTYSQSSENMWELKLDQTRSVEPALAINPLNGNILVAYMEFASLNPRMKYILCSQEGEILTSGVISNHASDPDVIFDQNGNAFISFINSEDNNSVSIRRSTNGGYSFENSVTVCTGSNDKPFFTIDNNPASPYFKRIYVAYTHFCDTDIINIECKYTTNSDPGIGNLQFSSPSILHSCTQVISQHFINGVFPIVNSYNNQVYIFWCENESSNIKYFFSKSTNGGITFSSKIVIMNKQYKQPGKELSDLYYLKHQEGVSNGFKYKSFPFAAVDPTSNIIYLVATANSSYQSNYSDHFVLWKSTNNGNTWIEKEFNNAANLDIFMPFLNCKENGSLLLTAYNSNVDPYNNFDTDIEISISSDQGSTFFKKIIRSDLNNQLFPKFDLKRPAVNNAFIGDYIESVYWNGNIYIAYSRTEEPPGNYASYVYLLKLPINVLTDFANQYKEDEITRNDLGQLLLNETNILNSPSEIHIEILDEITIEPKETFYDPLKFYKWTNPSETRGPQRTGEVVSPQSSKFYTYFHQTKPLTVRNALEGTLDGGTIMFGEVDFDFIERTSPHYENAFIYQEQNVEVTYRAEALALDPLYNTTWNFISWEDGTTNTIREEEIYQSSPSEWTAYYKSHLASNSATALSTGSQRKLFCFPDGTYGLVYVSDNKLWLASSQTTNFNSTWDYEEQLSNSNHQVKNPSVDLYNDDIVIVYENYNPSINEYAVYLYDYYQGVTEKVVDITPSYLGYAKPVVAFLSNDYNNGEIIVVYKKSSSERLKYKRRYKSAGNWVWSGESDLLNTNSTSINPSIAGYNISGSKYFHLVWQQSDYYIKYQWASPKGYGWSFQNLATVSSGSGFDLNSSPSVSIAGSNHYPVVSWTGRGNELGKILGKEQLVSDERVVVRARNSSDWGNFFIAGEEVEYSGNNSTTSGNQQTVINWSQSDGNETKWVKRIDGSFNNVHSLSHQGLYTALSSGSDLTKIKAVVSTTAANPLYKFNKATTNFNIEDDEGGGGLQKITSIPELTFGRSGVIVKNEVEFIFNTGDIVLADSTIRFIEVPDSVLFTSASQINTALITDTFALSNNSELYFTNYYFSNNTEIADTALTEQDYVSYRVELVNATSGEVTGTFDEITYNKQNLEKYENVNYQVNCSGISPGEYYLRLVVNVGGDASYYLADIQNDGTNLLKKNYTQINYYGNSVPTEYFLSQNYPNPFNPSTTIKYQIPNVGKVTLKIYDILGSEVATLVDQSQSEGRYDVNFNASSLASGVYIYRLNVNDFVNVKKMVLLK